MAIKMTPDMQTHEPFSKLDDNWATDDVSKPDPVDLPKVCGWYLLVRPVQIQEKTKGGIIMPGRAKADIESFTNIAKVLAVGDMAYKEERFKETPWCKVGDTVVFHRHSGHKFRWDGIKMMLIPDDKIMLVIDNAGRLDPTDDMADMSL